MGYSEKMAEMTLCLSSSADIEEILIEEVRDYFWNIKNTIYSKKTLKRCEEMQVILQKAYPHRTSLFSTPGKYINYLNISILFVLFLFYKNDM